MNSLYSGALMGRLVFFRVSSDCSFPMDATFEVCSSLGVCLGSVMTSICQYTLGEILSGCSPLRTFTTVPSVLNLWIMANLLTSVLLHVLLF